MSVYLLYELVLKMLSTNITFVAVSIKFTKSLTGIYYSWTVV